MGRVVLNYRMSEMAGGFKHLSLPAAEFRRFNPDILDLGNIREQGERIDALAAIMDLDGFTPFCSQMDPHLVVPEFLQYMLDWLFLRMSKDFAKEEKDGEVILWGKFPFFAKFMGDGILFLWETKGLGQSSMGNIVVKLFQLVGAYTTEFLPVAQKRFSNPPARLRCGVARGEVIAIGGGKDFIGPCINIASRLQKLSHLSFAFPKKGFNPDECFDKKWPSRFVLKRVPLRGIAKEELIFLPKKEFDALPDREAILFDDP